MQRTKSARAAQRGCTETIETAHVFTCNKMVKYNLWRSGLLANTTEQSSTNKHNNIKPTNIGSVKARENGNKQKRERKIVAFLLKIRHMLVW